MPPLVYDNGRCHRQLQDEDVPNGTNRVHQYWHSPMTNRNAVGRETPISAVEGKHLEENKSRQIPAEEVGDGDTEVHSTITADPSLIHCGPVPRQHDETSKRWNGHGLKTTYRSFPNAKNQKGKHPRTITNSEIRQDEQNWKVPYLRSHHICVVAVSEGKSCPQAQGLTGTTYR